MFEIDCRKCSNLGEDCCLKYGADPERAVEACAADSFRNYRPERRTMNIFKKRKKARSFDFPACGLKAIPSMEDPATVYYELPDGLRLIFREGKYAGWYLPGEEG